MSRFESDELIAFVTGRSTMEPAIRREAVSDPQIGAKLRLMSAVVGADLALERDLALESPTPASERDEAWLPFVSGIDEASNIFDSRQRAERRSNTISPERSAALVAASRVESGSRKPVSHVNSAVGGEDSEFQAALAQLSEGSEEAAWDIIQEYGPHIERVVRRRMDQRLRTKFDSQDFVQMVWASFFRHRSKINQFNEPQELIRHLAALAKHKVIDAARRGQTQKHAWDRERDYFTESGREPPTEGEHHTPSQYAMARECWNRMMSSESERNQRIVKMRIAGQTYEEIAAELDLHERTVRRVIERLVSKESGPTVTATP